MKDHQGYVSTGLLCLAIAGCAAQDRPFGSGSGGGTNDASASGGTSSGGGASTGGSSAGGAASGGANPGGADSGTGAAGSNTGGAPAEAGVCPSGKTDCDDAVAGCETDLASVLTCGATCGTREACKNTNALDVACSDGKCALTCSPGFADCDGKGSTGCETDLSAPTSCGTSCETTKLCPSARPVCAGGACTPIPSCEGLAKTCGSSGTESCCDNNLVSGGTFNRANDPTTRATLSDFRLDTYEITVSRFRKFVAAWIAGYRPAAGDGKHAHLNGGKGSNLVGGGYESGWDPAWAADIGTTAAEWDTKLVCDQYATWTGGKDYLPINCVSFRESVAFCTWDGGFLPTEAEWEYAAAGGSAQRAYPWGNTPPAVPPVGTNPTFAVFQCLYNSNGAPTQQCGTIDTIARPGSMVDGRGLYFHHDLAGNIAEWTMDYKQNYPAECVDCVNRTASSQTVARGGGFAGPAFLLPTAFRNGIDNDARYNGHGARCARRP